MISMLLSAVIFFYLLLIIAIAIQNSHLGVLAAIAIIITGTVLITDGVTGLDTILADSLGIINICFGAFVFINAPLEELIYM